MKQEENKSRSLMLKIVKGNLLVEVAVFEIIYEVCGAKYQQGERRVELIFSKLWNFVYIAFDVDISCISNHFISNLENWWAHTGIWLF